MAKQNAYLAKQEAVQRQCFNDGWRLGTQQMCDYISLALRDPETMGKDTFSGARILKVLKKTNEIMQYFRPAFLPNDEADWYQEQLDKALREAYKGNGETFYPFRERYDCLKEYDYKSGKWRGVKNESIARNDERFERKRQNSCGRSVGRQGIYQRKMQLG